MEEVGLIAAMVAVAAYYMLRDRSSPRGGDNKYAPVFQDARSIPSAMRDARGKARAVNLPDDSIGTIVVHESGYTTDFDPSVLDGHEDFIK
jgi:hypothetical protein